MNPSKDPKSLYCKTSKGNILPAVDSLRSTPRHATRSWALAAGSLALLMSGVVHAEIVAWKGETWDADPDLTTTLIVNGLDQLEVTATAASTSARAHFNTSPAYRAAATPWVQASFIETGSDGRHGLMLEDETLGPIGSAGAWIQFLAPQTFASTYRILYNNYDTDLADDASVNYSVFTTLDTGVARSVGERTFTIGRRADGTVDFLIDGSLVASVLSANLNPNFFGDFYLPALSTAPTYTATYTAFATGTDYVFGVPVPEASSAIPVAVAGLGLVAFALHRRRGV